MRRPQIVQLRARLKNRLLRAAPKQQHQHAGSQARTAINIWQCSAALSKAHAAISLAAEAPTAIDIWQWHLQRHQGKSFKAYTATHLSAAPAPRPQNAHGYKPALDSAKAPKRPLPYHLQNAHGHTLAAAASAQALKCTGASWYA